MFLDLETAQEIGQRAHFLGEVPARRRRFLDHRGVLLRCLIDLFHGAHADALLAHFPAARLNGIYTNFLPEYAYYNVGGCDGGAAMATIVALEERLTREGEDTLERFKARFDRLGPTHEVRKLDARASLTPSAMASLARGADLFVATTPYRDPLSSWDAIVEAVLFSAGRSLYLVPPKCHVRKQLRTILFAWQDTCEAARVAHEAMPFLKRADKVEVLVVDPSNVKSKGEEVADAAAHLARHGVTVEVSSVTSEDARIANTILGEADRISADTIVMGAFGHSRFREWVLGGVTRDLLECSRLPLIVAH